MMGWVFEKKVSLGTLIMLGIQTALGIWWLASQASELAQQGRRIEVIESVRSGERLAVLESTIGDIRQQLNRIESKLDRYAERDRPHP